MAALAAAEMHDRALPVIEYLDPVLIVRDLEPTMVVLLMLSLVQSRRADLVITTTKAVRLPNMVYPRILVALLGAGDRRGAIDLLRAMRAQDSGPPGDDCRKVRHLGCATHKATGLSAAMASHMR